MQRAEPLTLAEMQEFLAASNTLSFAVAGRRQVYGLVERILCAQQYLGLSKKTKGSCAAISSRSADSAWPPGGEAVEPKSGG